MRTCCTYSRVRTPNSSVRMANSVYPYQTALRGFDLGIQFAFAYLFESLDNLGIVSLVSLKILAWGAT